MAAKKLQPKDKKIKNTVYLTYPIGDFLIRLKNAAMAGMKEVKTPSSKLVKSVATLLKSEGYLNSVSESDGFIVVGLELHKKNPLLMDVKLISKPGLRIYKSVSEIDSFRGPTTLIVSTTEGILTGKQAVKANVGGEIIAEIL